MLAKYIVLSHGKLQPPDFQRGWVWDDQHLRSLLVSIARSSLIGAGTLLETGGKTRFRVRPVEGVELPPNTTLEELILDGQQRFTLLTQVFKFDKPVTTYSYKTGNISLTSTLLKNSKLLLKAYDPIIETNKAIPQGVGQL